MNSPEKQQPHPRGQTPSDFDELKPRIVALRNTGVSFAQISRATGLSVYLVKRAIAEMGVQETPAPSSHYKLNIPKERIEKLVAQGMTRNQIGSILGISNRSVLTMLARFGLQVMPSHHINRLLARQGKRRCSQCGEIKLLATDFYNNAGGAEGKGYRCKTCTKNWPKLAKQRAAQRNAPGQEPPHYQI